MDLITGVPHLNVGYTTSCGTKRYTNQDRYRVLYDTPIPNKASDFALFAVADGLGGYAGGEVAATIASNMLTELFTNRKAQADPVGYLDHLIISAHDEILLRKRADESIQSMGTTLTCVLIAEGRAYIRHSGDSRLYRISPGITQITRDHTDSGLLTNHLGMKGTLRIDKYAFPLKRNEVIILCTDGLTDSITDGRIKKIVESSNSMQNACDVLVEEAETTSGWDNITVVALKIMSNR